MESRLAEIEAKLSFSEDLLDELNRTVVRQQQQIDQLQQELRALRQHAGRQCGGVLWPARRGASALLERISKRPRPM